MCCSVVAEAYSVLQCVADAKRSAMLSGLYFTCHILSFFFLVFQKFSL